MRKCRFDVRNIRSFPKTIFLLQIKVYEDNDGEQNDIDWREIIHYRTMNDGLLADGDSFRILNEWLRWKQYA